MTYRITQSVEDGIERIVYVPGKKRFETPILMQHGMWHAAWCWEPWQKLFASWGWECHAYSLPGHGRSARRRAVRWCTLGYYDRFLAAEVKRMARPPVLMGHSMGGALVQRYLKRFDDLPAAVLVASWPSRSTLPPTIRVVRRHPWKTLRAFATLSEAPTVNTPCLVKDLFISEGALISPEELVAQLGPESLLIVFQHMPPFWRPTVRLKTPLLWLGGTHDNLNAESFHRASAADYGADYIAVKGANHHLMWEKSSQVTAEAIHRWLVAHTLS